MNTDNNLPLSPWPIADDSGAEASEAWHAANPKPKAQKRRRASLRQHWISIESGWRAFQKQRRKRLTEQTESQPAAKAAKKGRK